MILRCNFEELRALRAGARAFLGLEPEAARGVAAPPASRAHVEALVPHLVGDLELETLAAQRVTEAGLRAIVDHLRVEMEQLVAARHPADEVAVAAYFDFAHAYSVLARVEETGREMAALIELVTGSPPTKANALTFTFPD